MHICGCVYIFLPSQVSICLYHQVELSVEAFAKGKKMYLSPLPDLGEPNIWRKRPGVACASESFMLSINDHQNVHSRSLPHPYLEGGWFISHGSGGKQVTPQTGTLMKGPGQR